jgi:hypothetical protein
MAIEAVEVSARSAGRRFGLSDGMILMAGLALALAEGVHLWGLLAGRLVGLGWDVYAIVADLPWRGRPLRAALRDDFRNTLWYGTQVAESLLFGFTPAWIVLRLKRPRPARMVLLRQPGTVAVLAMVFGAFWITGALVTLFPVAFQDGNAMPSAVGGSVAVAWGVLAVGRMWESDPGWIERLGRLLGWTAIGLAVLRPLIFRI